MTGQLNTCSRGISRHGPSPDPINVHGDREQPGAPQMTIHVDPCAVIGADENFVSFLHVDGLEETDG
ncbi:hypothetical protein D3C85_1804950 [compost metagenome]